MKVERKEAADEKKILTGMIVSDDVLLRIAAMWEPEGLFRSKWSNEVARMCVDFYENYGEAPKSEIEALFTSWAEERDEGEVDLVDSFLGKLSGEYESTGETLNTEFVLDRAQSYFQRVRLERLCDKIKGDLEFGKIDKADERVSQFRRVDVSPSDSIDFLEDKQNIKEAFEYGFESLISYEGDLGRFINPFLVRDSFVSFLAPDKTGKSWWLIDVAMRAAINRLKVAYFECGDQSRRQLTRRLATKVCGRPLFARDNEGNPKEYRIPVKLTVDEDDGVCEVDLRTRSHEKDVSAKGAIRAIQTLRKGIIRSRKEFLRLEVNPADSISVDGIQSRLDIWEREGWTPDVIVIDYADILEKPRGTSSEERDIINATWKGLRKISQERHALVATATQADADSYDRDVLTKKNFSGDKRKNAHVTAMIGLNQTPAEKEDQVMRLNIVAARDADFNPYRVCHVAGSMAIGRPAMFSSF